MGVSLRSLAPQLNLSVASLFGYRNGKIPISPKAWSKLEQSELAALKAKKAAQIVIREGNLNDSLERLEESGAFVREDSALDELRRMSKQIKGPLASTDLSGFLERIAVALERLVEIEEGKKH